MLSLYNWLIAFRKGEAGRLPREGLAGAFGLKRPSDISQKAEVHEGVTEESKKIR